MTEQDKAAESKGLNENDAAESAASATGSQAEAAGGEEELDLWAAAMAEQQAQETPERKPEDNQPDEEEDLWAAAMAEQTQASAPLGESTSASRPNQNTGTSSAPAEGARPQSSASPAAQERVEAENAGERVFRPLEQSNGGGETRDLAMILDIPVRLSVELGRTKVTIKQLLEMAQGSVVELDGLAGEPMDILINGYLIAQGEVVVVEDKYGIRITEIVTPSERVQKLNR
jgi:flagellar motor switch protein FliN/FliY